MNLDQEKQDVDELRASLRTAKEVLSREEKAVFKAAAHLLNCQNAQEVVQTLAQAIQQQVHEKIAEVVSSCLEAVFDDPYTFKIHFERSRGKTEARLVFQRRGLEIDPLTASGGGAVDIAAFALRLSCLVLHRPRLSQVLALDEPFRFVSAGYQEKVRVMLEEISQRMGVQIVMVTHNTRYQTGKVVELD